MKLQNEHFEETRNDVAFGVWVATFIVFTATTLLILVTDLSDEGGSGWSDIVISLFFSLVLSGAVWYATRSLLGFYALVHGAKVAKKPSSGREEEDAPEEA